MADVPTLYVTLLDAISCRVLHRVAHFYASGPVSLAMVENWLVYSYWNTRAQRTEVRVAPHYVTHAWSLNLQLTRAGGVVAVVVVAGRGVVLRRLHRQGLAQPLQPGTD